MATSGTPGLNRVARQQGRVTPRAVKTVDRPREQWLEISVPAIVDQVTFARVRQRLEDNKRFAARNTKVPSLLQGLAACSACGYACYRGHATTTAGNKIFYYRCIGSDNYRFEHGKVCDSKPVRADYLDTVVWDHVTALLADPALIRAEITKRLEQARTADPATRQRRQLELALAKAATSITAMIEAYSEQLITIDELRTKMPHLRARQTSLRSQLDAIDAQAADRDAYLTLAGDLESFLAQLRGNAATATVEDRQRVLRLLVKDILIGPEKITIRHRIPARPGTRHRDHESDTEGDHRPSYLLRWGRVYAALRASLRGGFAGPGPGATCKDSALAAEDEEEAAFRLLDAFGTCERGLLDTYLSVEPGSLPRSSRIKSRTACRRAGLRDQTAGKSSIIMLIKMNAKTPSVMIRTRSEKRHESPPVVSKENGTTRHGQNIVDRLRG
jgi:site-specific DNA recombinase